MTDASYRFRLDAFSLSSVVGATTLESSVACITFQRFMIGIDLSSFLVES